jgi:hypothetical protein
MSDILITPNRGTSNAPTIQFSGSVNASASIRLEVLPEGQVAFMGRSGSLFSISDSLQGSLMAVSDISGLPILEVFSDDRVVMGKFNTNALVVTGSNVGIGKVPRNAKLDVSGSVVITGSLNTTLGATIQTLTVGLGAGSIASNTAVGFQALFSNTTGNENTAVGLEALYSNTSGQMNTATGRQALYNNTTGNDNTANGRGALRFNTTGARNTAMGRSALITNTTGNDNTAVGYFALLNNTTGNYNTANGYQSLYSNTTGSGNTANGYDALYSNTTGIDNTAMGLQALRSNTTGSYNTANGYTALYSNTTGNSNTAIGREALYSNTTGNNNTATGIQVLRNNTTGINNTATGVNALFTNTTGANNTTIGGNGLYSNTTGNENTSIGRNSLQNNTTGTSNTAIGYNAGLGITTGNYNTIIGANVTGLASSLSNNIIIADGLGNRRINIDDSGNVAIGKTAPFNALLDVNGNVSITGSLNISVNARVSGGALRVRFQSALDGIRFTSGSSDFGGGGIFLSNSRMNFSAGSGTPNGFVFNTNATSNAVFIRDDGSLNVFGSGSFGKTAPINATLDISGKAIISGSATMLTLVGSSITAFGAYINAVGTGRVGVSSAVMFVGGQSGMATTIQANNANVITIDTSHNVGIGKTTPNNAKLDVSGSVVITGSLTVTGTSIPQNSQSATYTLIASDANKHIYHPSADTTARTWTIPSNATVAYDIGTAITFVNDTSAGVITISITTDTLVLAGTGTTGSRTLAANGVATAIKVTSTRWIISGTGLT